MFLFKIFFYSEEEPESMLTSGKYFRDLIKLSLEEINERETAREAFLKATQYPIKQIEDRFKNLTLSNRPVIVRKWPSPKMTQEIEDTLKKLDPDYNSSLRSMKELKKMPILHKILSDKDHVQMSEYCIQIRTCGIEGCSICKLFGRGLRVPETNDGRLKELVSSFLPLPIPDPTDQDHYLNPKETIAHVKRFDLCFEEQKKFLPQLVKKHKDPELVRDRKIDQDIQKKKLFKRNKVRRTIQCTNCPMVRVIYSMYQVGSNKGGPKKKHENELQRYIEERNYICGAEIPVKRYEARRAIRCYDYIESQYYDKNRKKICCICSTESNLATRDEIMKRQKYAVHNPLPVCSDCLNLNIKLPGGGTNYLKQKKNKQAKKAELLRKALQSGRKKGKKKS